MSNGGTTPEATPSTTYATPQYYYQYPLMHERREEYLEYGVPLYKAALRGDWKRAKEIHERHSNCFTERITRQGDTALHIAALARRTEFVVQLVSLMVTSHCERKLTLMNNIGNTALCLAAASGTVAIAKVMVHVNPSLPTIRGNGGLTPLHMAALSGHRDMVNFLLTCTPDRDLSERDRATLFFSTIYTDLHDIALNMMSRYPQLAFARDEQNETPLHVLAKSNKLCGQSSGIWRKCCSLFNVFGSQDESVLQLKALQLVKCLWGRVIQESQDDIATLMAYPWRLLFVAVEVGNVDFVTALICSYPDLIWKLDDNHRTIFHVAVKFRQETIFRLIYETGAIKDVLATYVDESTGNNMLHLAALLPSSDRLNCISGPALQMQREMLWFKVVEDLLQPQLAETPNEDGDKPRALFTEQHKELRKEGEEWMRKTASSCSFVATLIASVAFGAALKVLPNSENGSNPFGNGLWYWVFAISDSVSLISSTAAILMFLSILTSRYAQEDFFQSLPLKLMIGLTLLFVSIATMMIAFTATFSIIVKHGLLWLVSASLACVPIVLFALQEFPLLLEVYRSTIRCNFVFKPRHELFSPDC